MSSQIQKTKTEFHWKRACDRHVRNGSGEEMEMKSCYVKNQAEGVKPVGGKENEQNERMKCSTALPSRRLLLLLLLMILQIH